MSNFFSLNRWLCGIFALAHSVDLSSPPSHFFLLFIIPVVDIVSEAENYVEETLGDRLATAFSQESGQVYCLKAILLPINCRKMELFPRGVATDQTAPRRPFPVQSQGISSHSLVALARTLEYFLPLKL